MACSRVRTASSRPGGVAGISLRTRRSDDIRRLGRGGLECFELRALPIIRADDAIDLVGRPRHNIGVACGSRVCCICWLPRPPALVCADAIKARFLIVAERVVEFGQRRQHDVDSLHKPVQAFVHIVKPTRGRECHARRAVGLDHVAGLDDGIAEIIEQCALLLIRLHGISDVVDWPAGDLSGFVDAALRDAPGQLRHARRCARPTHVLVIGVRRKQRLVDVAITIGPDRIVGLVFIGPKRVIEKIAIGVRPEQRTDPT